MTTEAAQAIKLYAITARHNHTLLPRILQILSRRGCTLIRLDTQPIGGDMARLNCTIQAPERWHGSLPGLLLRLIDIESVEVFGAEHHE